MKPLKMKSVRKKKKVRLWMLKAMTGIPVATLSEIENGQRHPRPDELEAIARALQVTVDEISATRERGVLDRLRDRWKKLRG
jgi:transcriptional regulator with XRE-family HTH domain